VPNRNILTLVPPVSGKKYPFWMNNIRSFPCKLHPIGCQEPHVTEHTELNDPVRDLKQQAQYVGSRLQQRNFLAENTSDFKREKSDFVDVLRYAGLPLYS
jgi:hypothetical protein